MAELEIVARLPGTGNTYVRALLAHTAVNVAGNNTFRINVNELLFHHSGFQKIGVDPHQEIFVVITLHK